jgi:AcrR family transcriptional regulator
VRSPFQQSTPREQQRDETRSRLYEAALVEFRRVGFGRASVARIAAAAGVARPTFYFHFPTKEHVLLELQWHLETRLAERLRAWDSLAEATEDLIEGVIENALRVGDPDLYRDMLGIYTRHSRDRDLGLADHPFPVVGEIGRLFLNAAESGELRSGLDPAQATHLFLAGVYGYQVATSGDHEETRADLRAFVSLFLETETIRPR